MNTPPEVDALATKIARAHPFARVQIDPPLLADGTYCIDIRLADRLVVVEWDARGYGIFLVAEAALDASPDIRVETLDEALEQVTTRLDPVTCGIADESLTFTCLKAWGHNEPTHSGIRRGEDGNGHGKSWLANDEEHLRRLALKTRS